MILIETFFTFFQITRFLTQVTTDNVSLTGLKFFSITRSLVLTVCLSTNSQLKRNCQNDGELMHNLNSNNFHVSGCRHDSDLRIGSRAVQRGATN